MEEYRKKLKTQNLFYIIGAVILTAVQVLSFSGKISPAAPNGKSLEFLTGFIAGAAMGVTLILLFGLIVNLVCLHNEERLKKLYLKETDERICAIAVKGKSGGATIGLCGLIVAAIVAGYFDVTVFIVIMSCAVFLALCMAGGKIYYSGKM